MEPPYKIGSHGFFFLSGPVLPPVFTTYERAHPGRTKTSVFLTGPLGRVQMLSSLAGVPDMEAALDKFAEYEALKKEASQPFVWQDMDQPFNVQVLDVVYTPERTQAYLAMAGLAIPDGAAALLACQWTVRPQSLPPTPPEP